MKTIHKLYIVSILALLVSACQSKPKLPVPTPNPNLAAIQKQTDAFLNTKVTWGEVILETQAKEKETHITILSRPLSSSTRPKENDHSDGRFIAKIKGFLDPAVFTKQRELTVHGEIVGTEQQKVGEYDYQYTVINVSSYYLWPPRPEYDPRDDDYWYGPWYRPYPYYPYRHHPRTIKSIEKK